MRRLIDLLRQAIVIDPRFAEAYSEIASASAFQAAYGDVSALARGLEAAYKALFATYRKNSGVLGEIYQNIVVEWRNEGISLRGYMTPISVRNIANNLDDATVDALLAACRKNAGVTM